jgi:hypothetical protein
MNELTQNYLDCWNETDPATRRQLVDEVFAADVTYTDPMGEASGRDALVATIDAVQQQFPDFVFTPIGEADGHHQQVRFQWGLGPVGAEPPLVGFDVAVVNGDGQITAVLGFLDRVPS